MKEDLAKRIVQSLKDAGIDFVTYLPETRLSQIVPLIRDDPDVELIAAASEQEAVTIAAGATLGGKQAAVYMENTGIYVSCYSLLTVGKQLGVPLLLAAKMTDQLVVTSQSGQRIEWSHLSHHEGNLLVGMMGCAVGVGMGLALALPHRKIIVLDSDGSVLLSLFNLPTLGNLQPKNLVIYVFDNGVYSGSRI